MRAKWQFPSWSVAPIISYTHQYNYYIITLRVFGWRFQLDAMPLKTK